MSLKTAEFGSTSGINKIKRLMSQLLLNQILLPKPYREMLTTKLELSINFHYLTIKMIIICL